MSRFVLLFAGWCVLLPARSPRVLHAQEPLDRWTAVLGNLVQETQFGSLDHEPTVFGQIAGVVADENAIHILDRQFDRIRTYAYSGALLAETGKRGEGPGEFYLPSAITRVADQLIVVDQRRRMTTITWNNGRHELVDSRVGPVDVVALCALRDHTVAYGVLASSTGSAHLLDWDWEVGKSLGPYPPSANRMANLQKVNGAVGCDPERDIVYTARNTHPRVTAWDVETGDFLWRVDIPGFIPIEVSLLSPTGGILNSMPEGATHIDEFESIVPLPEGLVLVQVQEVGERGVRGRLKSYLIDGEGVIRALQAPLPLIVARHGSRVISVAQDLVPSVTVWRYLERSR